MEQSVAINLFLSSVLENTLAEVKAVAILEGLVASLAAR